jgi:CRISPR/Cas system-associated protein Cas5 (RAMP superfamily)
MKKAIVTITLGETFKKMFNELCRENWQKYCDKYSYDLIIINEPLDTTERSKKRSPSWQKLLILSQDWSQNYERIVCLDRCRCFN